MKTTKKSWNKPQVDVLSIKGLTASGNVVANNEIVNQGNSKRPS